MFPIIVILLRLQPLFHCALCQYLHKSETNENKVLEDETKALKYNNNTLKAKLKAVTVEIDPENINAVKAKTAAEGNKHWAMVSKELFKQKSVLEQENIELKTQKNKL